MRVKNNQDERKTKHATSFKLTDTALDILAELAIERGIPKQAVIENLLRGEHPDARTQLDIEYIGAVALLTRVFSRLDAPNRRDLELNNAIERLASDFNRRGYSLRLVKSSNGYGLAAK